MDKNSHSSYLLFTFLAILSYFILLSSQFYFFLMDRQHDRKVHCECHKCRRFTIHGIVISYKMIDYRMQRAHQKNDDDFQEEMNLRATT